MREDAIDTREKTMLEAVRAAGRKAREFLADPDPTRLAVGRKGPQDYVSAADRAIERALRQRLLGAFPSDGFLGEEFGGARGSELWVVDPIDGTANFVRALPHFCVSIAFVTDGEPIFGAILDPSLDELYSARRGRGAYRNGRAIRVASTRVMSDAAVEIGWSTRVPDDRYLACVGRVLGAGASVRRGGSGALGLAYVADGRSDAYVELHINAWDCMAGLLLVTEAGGRVSPFLETGGLEKGAALLATAPGVADQMAELTGIAFAHGGEVGGVY